MYLCIIFIKSQQLLFLKVIHNSPSLTLRLSYLFVSDYFQPGYFMCLFNQSISLENKILRFSGLTLHTSPPYIMLTLNSSAYRYPLRVFKTVTFFNVFHNILFHIHHLSYISIFLITCEQSISLEKKFLWFFLLSSHTSAPYIMST